MDPVSTSSDKLPVKAKIAYGVGAANDMWGNWLYPSMVWPVFNIFLLVNPALVSAALMINRFFDAFSDPFFGWWSDNTRTRMGRRRPFILVGAILAGLSFPALFLVSSDWGEYAIFIYMLISSCIYITIVSCFNMPYQSLGYEMTPDYNERTSVFAYRGAIQKIFEVTMFGAAAFATASVWVDASAADVPHRLWLMITQCFEWMHAVFTSLITFDAGGIIDAAKSPFGWSSGEGEPNTLLGAQVYACIIGGMMILVGLIVFFGVKERYYGKVVERNQKKVALKDTFGKVLKCRPFRAQLAMSLAYGWGTSMLGSLGYYLTVYYVCAGDVTLGSIWNFGMGLSGMLFGLIGVPFFAGLAKRFGKIKAMMACQLSAMAVFVLCWWLYNPEVPWLQFFASGAIAFTQGGFWALYGAIGADVVDYDELETGVRREGAFSACATYLMKFGLASGIGLSGVVLNMAGFDAELGANQAESTITNIRIYFSAFPILGLLLAFWAIRRFGLGPERMEDIRTQLEAKRGKIQ